MKKFQYITFILLVAFTTNSFVHGQICNLTTGYVGNTFNGNDKWVQNISEELDVASDGTMVTTSTWDEAGRCIGVWKDGQPVTLLKQPDPNDGCWGWGTGTEAAAIDDDYLYVVNCKNNLLRWNRKTGYSYVDKTNVGDSAVVNMTYSAGYIYLIKTDGVVEKRSVSGLGNVSLSFTVTDGYDLAVDINGDIWVLTSSKEVIKYNGSGITTGIKITGQTGWSPAAINYDAYNNLVLVSDNGPRRQVIKFNTASGEQVGTFGDLGGISGGPTPGLVGDLRFWNIAGCGTDSNGNIYVALNEKGTSLRKFNSNGVKQWEVQARFFVDQTSIDPASDGNDIYGVNEHMKYDYDTNTWSLHAITCDAIANPTDPRITKDGSISLMRRVNGNLLMYVTDMYANHFDIFRFNGEIAVFCQTIEGVGWSGLPDKNGNIWYESGSSIRKIPLTGFTNGVPVFGTEQVVSSIPAPMTGVERLEYDADNDVMYIGGWTATNGNGLGDWGIVGSTIARYPNWSTGNRTASSVAIPPKDASGHVIKAMSVADDYLFCGLSSESGKLYVYNTKDLTLLGNMPVPASMGLTGWLDVPFAIQTFKKSNGQYLILVEDDFRGKNILHQWCPTGDCTPNDQMYPDLVPSEFEIINANNEIVTKLTAGQTVRFRVKVTNQGTAISPAGNNYANGKSFKIKFNIINLETNATKLLVADTITQALAPGQSTEVVSYSTSLSYEWVVPKGKFSITTQVNPIIGANIVECNKTNNNLVFNTNTYDVPYFLTKLVDKIIDFGQSTSFSVEVLGDGPIEYKWYLNGVEQNVNSNELVLNNVPINLNGAKIKVIATNQLGSTASNEVTLTVLAVMQLTGGVKFASSGNETEGNAFDGDITTFFDGLSESYMGKDYGSPKKVIKIRFYPRNNWAGRMNGGKFQGSNDDIDYTDIYTINYTPTSQAWTVVALQNAAEYRYFRYQGPVNGYGNVAEIEFWSPYIINGLEESHSNNVLFYPNPVNDKLLLSIAADRIIITGIDGKDVLISKGSNVDVSSLAKGIYLVKYFVGGSIGVSKIVKR